MLPEQRLEKHISNHKGFTAKAKDWTIVHTEEYKEKKQAARRERKIKSVFGTVKKVIPTQ